VKVNFCVSRGELLKYVSSEAHVFLIATEFAGFITYWFCLGRAAGAGTVLVFVAGFCAE
jgi:hypothetical protein